MAGFRFNVGDKVFVREDLDPNDLCEIEICDEDGDVCEYDNQDCLGRYTTQYRGQELTICYIDVDEDDDRVWYACEESGGYEGVWDTNWWPAGAFIECKEREVLVDVNPQDLMNLLDV